MHIIGLTGSIASGKSATAQICRQMGIPIHDADKYVHQLMGPYGHALGPIMQKFGDIGTIETGIDRQALGKVVFSDSAAKDWIENLLHPMVATHRDRFIRQHRIWRFRRIILDVPLLFEVGVDEICDNVITVWAPDFLRKQRALQRSGMTEERYEKICSLQISQDEKCRLSDLALPTGLGYAETRRRLKRFLSK